MKKLAPLLFGMIIVIFMVSLSKAAPEANFYGSKDSDATQNFSGIYEGLPFLAWTGDEHDQGSSARNAIAWRRLNEFCVSQGFQRGDMKRSVIKSYIGNSAYFVNADKLPVIVGGIRSSPGGISSLLIGGLTGGFAIAFYSEARVFSKIVCVGPVRSIQDE